MDAVIIMALICSYVGLLAQSKISGDGLRWLTVCLGIVALLMVLESGWDSVPAVTGLSISAGITVLYSLAGIILGVDHV